MVDCMCNNKNNNNNGCSCVDYAWVFPIHSGAVWCPLEIFWSIHVIICLYSLPSCFHLIWWLLPTGKLMFGKLLCWMEGYSTNTLLMSVWTFYFICIRWVLQRHRLTDTWSFVPWHQGCKTMPFSQEFLWNTVGYSGVLSIQNTCISCAVHSAF